jgi:hypothetical protein
MASGWIDALAGLDKNFAYLDPGSGSFILQVLIASLLAGMLFIKTFWRKITGGFRKSDASEDREIGGDEGPDEQ